MRKLWLLPATHEEAFLARYDQLMQAALHLAGNDRERAEDLLHTVFVQFTLASPDLGAIRNLDDYLFVSLRNTQISQARRNATVEAAELSLTDYDSAEIRLKDARPVERLLAEDQLWTVCVAVFAPWTTSTRLSKGTSARLSFPRTENLRAEMSTRPSSFRGDTSRSYTATSDSAS
jgi:predicted RNA polymerase sigma factor